MKKSRYVVRRSRFSVFCGGNCYRKVWNVTNSYGDVVYHPSTRQMAREWIKQMEVPR